MGDLKTLFRGHVRGQHECTVIINCPISDSFMQNPTDKTSICVLESNQ
jgi:hypothetical protein